jgi:hypothetical protein
MVFYPTAKQIGRPSMEVTLQAVRYPRGCPSLQKDVPRLPPRRNDPWRMEDFLLLDRLLMPRSTRTFLMNEIQPLD